MASAPDGRGLLDTSVVIALGEVALRSLPPQAAISAVTLAELTAGPSAADSELEGARRQRRLQFLEGSVETLDFDTSCARAYGPIFAATAARGRKPRGGRAVDLLIAATALAHGLPLYTMNGGDLHGLEELIEIVEIGSP